MYKLVEYGDMLLWPAARLLCCKLVQHWRELLLAIKINTDIMSARNIYSDVIVQSFTKYPDFLCPGSTSTQTVPGMDGSQTRIFIVCHWAALELIFPYQHYVPPRLSVMHALIK